jgi:predicted alpha/beta superfamily hydrolase
MNLETLYLNIDTTQSLRRIRVLLPNHYFNSNDRYPVIYMHDGQNLFFDCESFSGVSWGIYETLSKLNLSDLIVVGIDNSDQRTSEYAPWKISKKIKYDQNIGGLGDQYADFVVNTLKPKIDETYRTKIGPSDTMIAGSSLGAYISCYIGFKYPDLFGIIGSFSLASWFNEKKFLDHLKSKTLNENQRYFVSIGRFESSSNDVKNFNQIYLKNSQNLVDTLNKKGIKDIYHLVTDDTHHESAWRSAFETFILWINKKV